MTGTILNAMAILAGGVAGLLMRRPIPPKTQLTLKLVLGVLTVFVGLKMTFTSMGGGFGLVIKQFIIMTLALMLGRLTGKGLHLQKALNHLGQYAKKKIEAAKPDNPSRFNDGFITGSILFCAAPIAILGAFQDGLAGQWQTLGIKAVMDGLATMTFVGMFGTGIILSMVPVVAFQGTISLAVQYLTPYLQDPAQLQSVQATGGLLVFSIALIILEVRRIELADYLPSLAYAPLLTWIWS